ncbi:hypothetical protein H5410_058507 [Solanum commersonii]|uniref:Uncharacterized protein n=1 Tax=Solanum commersonii TaxID=4109 RepID=A0A9J5WSW0_SOLCO|nr:hypothetical protein H5410_058507 [Solanum commersonii]
MMPDPCQILQSYTIFGGSDTHPSKFWKSLSNIERSNIPHLVSSRHSSSLPVEHQLLYRSWHCP